MSLSDEGNRPSNEQTASETAKRAPSGQNGTEQGLPGLAGFGQMPGYAPVTAQPQAPSVSEPEPEYTETPMAQDFSGELEYPDTIDEPDYTEIPLEPDYSETHSAPEYAEVPAASAEQPELVAPLGLSAETYPQELGADHPGFSSDEEPQYANPPGFLDPNAGEPAADTPFVSENMQSFVNEHQPENIDTAGHAAAGGFDAGLGLNTDQALHADTSNSLQTFEAHYDQHPEIPLGVFDEPGEAQSDQPFFHEPGQEGDAEFLSGEPGTDIAEPKERKGRKILMAASGLIGIMALGGALAFAYKIGGESDIASTGKPPLIQADNTPVKIAPAKPGGKQFPHKNKKIYERLQGENSQVVERLVPRQESVAVAATAALGTPKTAEANIPARAPSPTGAPRKVKTLTVRPDGTIESATPRQKVVKAPEPVAAGIAMKFPQSASTQPAATAPAPSPVLKAPVSAPPVAAAPAPKNLGVVAPPPAAPVKSAPQHTASLQRAPASAPPPLQKPQVPAPAPQRAAPRLAPAPVASSSEYVVQVAARKSQTDALAAFADIQQKYPQLLSGYRPIIKKADLGSKGVWYRLNVGPVESKKVASSLCGSLKGAGMRSCIIRAQ